jgi:hypothetical protein
MSGPHGFGLQNRTADGVSTITSRLDERFRYRQDLESLERVAAAQETGRWQQNMRRSQPPDKIGRQVIVSANLLQNTKTPLQGEMQEKNWQ